MHGSPTLRRSKTGLGLGVALSALLTLAGMGGAAAGDALLMPGDLDPTFGPGGTVTTDLGPGDNDARAVAVDLEGRVVTAGSVYTNGQRDFTVSRYRPDGTLDPTFGTGGVVTTDFGGQSDEAAEVVVGPDGRITAAGYARMVDTTDFAVARYLPDGHPDPTFGVGGVTTTDAGGNDDEIRGLALTPDGGLVAGGCTACHQPSADFAVARYAPNGTLDAAFGTAGLAVTDFAGQIDEAEALALQADGRIVAAGFAGVAQPGGHGPGSRYTAFALARYTTDGRPDPTFGTGGRVTTRFGEENDAANALAIRPDGTILAAGLAFVGESFDFALAGYRPDGELDDRFGQHGRVTTDFGGGTGYALGESASGLAVTPNGMVVAAGTDRGEASFAVARYTASGIPDLTFGRQGTVTTRFDGGDAGATGVAIGPDGEIVTAGVATTSGEDRAALASYRGDISAGNPSRVE